MAVARLAAATPIGPQAWEFPCAVGAALKSKNKQTIERDWRRRLLRWEKALPSMLDKLEADPECGTTTDRSLWKFTNSNYSVTFDDAPGAETLSNHHHQHISV